MTNTGIQPASPWVTLEKIIPRKAEIMPIKSESMKMMPHFSSLDLIWINPTLPFEKRGS